MAKLVTKAAMVMIGGTDYSAQVKSATLTIDAPEVDLTNMASGGWAESLGGIQKATLAIEFVKDAVLSGLDAAIFAALGTPLSFEVRQQNTARSVSNPAYTGSVLITQWAPIQGQVGQAFGGSVSWPSTGVVARQTS